MKALQDQYKLLFVKTKGVLTTIDDVGIVLIVANSMHH